MYSGLCTVQIRLFSHCLLDRDMFSLREIEVGVLFREKYGVNSFFSKIVDVLIISFMFI